MSDKLVFRNPDLDHRDQAHELSKNITATIDRLVAQGRITLNDIPDPSEAEIMRVLEIARVVAGALESPSWPKNATLVLSEVTSILF